MMRIVNKLFFLSVMFTAYSSKGETISDVVAAVVECAHKVTHKVSKKNYSKSPIEFKQAVDWYIRNTENNCMHMENPAVGKLPSYEIELNYLFSNYTKFSHNSLLSRLRSAHQAFVKNNIYLENDRAERFEQISSALILTCAQVCADNTRKQLLDALQEVDELMIYWRTQQNHWIRYFFHKSPTKWIMGKKQEREIWDNIKNLEHKQAELYTILGKLTAHLHSFTDCGVGYAYCYDWVEELFSVLTCIVTPTEKVVDETRFDRIAAKLELKTKNVGYVKYNSLLSVTSSKKSNHFVRNWIIYTTTLAAAGYAVHYHYNNPDDLFQAINSIKIASQDLWQGVVVDRMKDLSVTLFGRETKVSADSIVMRADRIRTVGATIQSGGSKECNKTTDRFLIDAVKSLDNIIDDAKTAGFQFNAQELRAKALQEIKLKIEDLTILAEAMSVLENVAHDGKAAGFDVNVDKIIEDVSLGDFKAFEDLIDKMNYSWNPILKIRAILAKQSIMIIKGYLYPLNEYLRIIDESILPTLQEIGYLGADIGEVVGAMLKDNMWTAKLAAFTPLAAACIGITKTYKWATFRDYSPIRIALADVNSLLIESPMPLDNHDYGKLIYLAYKLRNKAVTLKDALSDEFLVDIKKLESKQFDVVTKRGIVDNMFNKYGFLGRIAA